jgi:lipopolysaccharide export system permease protein
MGKTLHSYILRETAQTWLAVTGVLLLILLTDQFARVLDDAAVAKVPRDAILAVMGLSSIQYMTILIPVGILLAVMLSLARLYRDSEMAAMMACGIGNISLYRPIMIFALGLAVLSGWLALQAGPYAQRQIQTIADQAKQDADLAVLEAGRFISFGRENVTLYAEEVTADGRLKNVFVERRDGRDVVVIVAEEASQRNDRDTAQKVLTFSNGKRYEGEPGSKEFRVMEFAEHGIPFAVRETRASEAAVESMTLTQLLDKDDSAAVAEIQWRLSVPLTLIVLTLIAVPLARSRPRQGRYNNLVAAILLYIIYVNLLGAARVWVEQQVLPAWLGLWWVHLIFLALAGSMLMRQNRIFSRLRSRAHLSQRS